ncbi:arabinofuranosidase catalytic domain-containing protein [Dinghuibacter silviterrae]|uniref:Putative secreted protein (Por secretion system target) n=1 Tax=Dinghuibacter silviterrae TaxID=1539049 RepID=A0A4R8DW72_9BACT|nr:arabinofuranosidase catalytic domain-containing protein [Dinghuibacter silviterrae]TDX02316.1 putative secreted protein (Por secretion system target) [Dinghuibacter silviterrae]
MKIQVSATLLACLFANSVLAGNTLDKTGNPTATALVAFSVRQLSSAYTGYDLKVCRSHDKATANIGFTGAGDLDTATMKAFVGTDTGYVSVWYDQSGNGYNATPTADSTMPYIMVGGSINRDNGWPSLYTSMSAFLSYGPVSQLNGTYQVTRMEVCRSRDNSSLSISEGLGTYQLDLQLFPAAIWVQFEDNNIVATGTVSSTQSLMSINSVRNNGNSLMYLNTALLGSTTASILPFSAPVMGFVGVRFDYAVSPAGQGAFSETILFNSVLSDADRQAINYNENWYYSLGFDPCSSTAAALSPNNATSKALYACTQDGPWAYYYDPAHPLNLLFGIAKDPGSTGANATFAIDSIDLTVAPNPATAGYSVTSGTNGIFAMGRYWNVFTHTPLTSPVDVRFFFNPTDTTAALNAALAFKTGSNVVSNLQWFKTVGGPFNQDSLTATPVPYIKGPILPLTPVYGTKNGVNYAEFDGVPSFSGGTGVYIVSATPITLPIVINPFTAVPANHAVLLNWTTQSENNSLLFEIDRSADGKTWAAIGEVNAAGNSENATSYSFTDSSPLQSNYYRLKLVYKNGQYFFSDVVVAGINTTSPQVYKIVPNPFKNNLDITATVPNGGPVEVRLLEITGVTLLRQEYTATKGGNVFTLTNLSRLSPGMYIVQVIQGGVVGVGKVVKE